MLKRGLALLLGLFVLNSCMTYYERNLLYHQQFASHEYEKANETLDKNKNIQKSKNMLLYYLEKGVTLQMMEQYDSSNAYFEKAYIFVDDFSHNVGRDALSLVTNDMVRNYGGEDFERIYIHYYKALNYIMLRDLEAAMVEARRINIKLNEINDKYKGENKFKRDAFAHVLMGLLYEASGNENDAFIAYRNAYDVYKEDYAEFFDMKPPEQLKKDLIRTAALNGFYDSQEFYEREFKMNYKDMPKREKELIFFWHKGMGPIKDEWSINFVVVRGSGGLVVFSNKELGLSFTFYTRSQDEYNSLGDLKVVRVAFPKYSTRKEVITRGIVDCNGEEYDVELLEDVDKVAIKSLNDRMMRELAKTLLRVALKQAAEQRARQEDEGFGAMVSVLNAVTEKADTRNWQTLPAKIYYARIPIEKDSNDVNIITYKAGGKIEEKVEGIQSKGKFDFGLYHSISPESIVLNNPY